MPRTRYVYGRAAEPLSENDAARFDLVTGDVTRLRDPDDGAMVYDWRNGRFPKVAGDVVFAASGVPVGKVFYFDASTGTVGKYIPDQHGVMHEYWIEDVGPGVFEFRVRGEAPKPAAGRVIAGDDIAGGSLIRIGDDGKAYPCVPLTGEQWAAVRRIFDPKGDGPADAPVVVEACVAN